MTLGHLARRAALFWPTPTVPTSELRMAWDRCERIHLEQTSAFCHPPLTTASTSMHLVLRIGDFSISGPVVRQDTEHLSRSVAACFLDLEGGACARMLAVLSFQHGPAP